MMTLMGAMRGSMLDLHGRLGGLRSGIGVGS